jgi:hypothetical protein
VLLDSEFPLPNVQQSVHAKMIIQDNSQRACNMLDCDSDKRHRTITFVVPCFLACFRRTRHGANVKRRRLDWAEEHVYVECGQWDGGVYACYGSCESGLCVWGGEGAGWVVDDPKRHVEGVV